MLTGTILVDPILAGPILVGRFLFGAIVAGAGLARPILTDPSFAGIEWGGLGRQKKITPASGASDASSRVEVDSASDSDSVSSSGSAQHAGELGSQKKLTPASDVSAASNRVEVDSASDSDSVPSSGKRSMRGSSRPIYLRTSPVLRNTLSSTASPSLRGNASCASFGNIVFHGHQGCRTMTHPDKNGNGSLVAHRARRFAQCAGDQVDLATTRVGLATSI